MKEYPKSAKRAATSDSDDSGRERANHSCPECGTSEIYAVGYRLLRCYRCNEEITVLGGDDDPEDSHSPARVTA